MSGHLRRCAPIALSLGLVLSAAAPAAARTIGAYDGSSTPIQVQVEPWATVLPGGPVATLQVDARGDVVAVDAAGGAVAGVVDAVEPKPGGRFVIVIDGRSYWARKTTLVADGGVPLGPLARNSVLPTDNEVVALLGPDGWIGYLDVV